MKNISRVITLIVLVLSILGILQNIAFAIDDLDTMKGKADSFINYGKDHGGDDVISDSELQNFAIPIAKALVSIATVIVTVVTVVVGIQYTIASPADKAKLKQKLIGLVVSIIVIYGAQGIWAIVYSFMNSVTN